MDRNLQGQPPARPRVLIVEGDQRSADALRLRLADVGFHATLAARVEDAVAACERSDPHLVVLDWDLPGGITTALVRHIGRRTANGRPTRLLAVSSYAGEDQIVGGLEQGLDDYVSKPYSITEVAARARALVRPLRRQASESALVECGNLRIDPATSRVSIGSAPVTLRPAEFRMLQHLARHPGRAFAREALLLAVWGRSGDVQPRAVDVTVQRLRQALVRTAWSGEVQTVRGLGYRLATETGGTGA